MSNTHSTPQPFTVVVDACTRQLKYADSSLFSATTGSVTRGATTLEAIDAHASPYRRNYIVYVHKRRLGTVGVEHLKVVVDRDLLAFRYDNATLYRDHVADMGQFLADFDLTAANITRLEIAVDTNHNVQADFLTYFTNPQGYHYNYSPTVLEKVRLAGEMYRDGSQNFTLYPHIAADKKLKIYDKSAELEASGKPYISDYHRANGLDTTRPVYRVELTLLNTAFKAKVTEYVRGSQHLTPHHYKQLSDGEKRGFKEVVTVLDTTPAVADLRDAEKLLALFYKYTNDLTAFSVKDNPRRSRCTPVRLLNLGAPAAPVGIAYFNDAKKYKIQMTATYKTLLRNFYATNNDMYLRTAVALAKDTDTDAELQKQIKALAPLRTLYATTAPARVPLPL